MPEEALQAVGTDMAEGDVLGSRGELEAGCPPLIWNIELRIVFLFQLL